MKYNKILLKLSEAIGGPDGVGLDEEVMARYAEAVASVVPRCRLPLSSWQYFPRSGGTERGLIV